MDSSNLNKLSIPLLVTHHAVSLSGSAIDSSSHGDIDFIIKSSSHLPSLEKFFQDYLDEEDCDFVYDPRGSSWDHVPIGDFVLIPKSSQELRDEKLGSCRILPSLEGITSFPIFPNFLSFKDDKFYILWERDTGLEIKINKVMGESFPFEYVGDLPGEAIASLYFVPAQEVKLVKVRDPFFKEERESVAEAFSSPLQKIEPMKAKSGYSKFEFYDTESFWNAWGKTNATTGFYLEPKVDGIRMVGAKRGDEVIIYTEDKKRERQEVLVDLADELRKLPVDECTVDGEVVWFKDGKPVPRWDMAALVSGKEPIKGEDIRWFLFDCLYHSGKGGSLIDSPIEKRQEVLDDLVPRKSKSPLHRLPIFKASARWELEKAFEKCAIFPSSEGAMVKLAGSKYDIKGRTGNWAKIKQAKELHVRVIGRMKKAGQFDEGEKPSKTLTGDEALSLYKKLQEDSDTYILRCAVKSGDKLIPIDADRKLTSRNLEIRWNTETSPPKWQGLDDPRLWEMSDRVDKRREGDYAFGNTYGRAFDEPPKVGDIVVVRPMKVRYEDGHISWMFPTLHHKDETRTSPDDLETIKKMAEAKEKVMDERICDEIEEYILEGAYPRAFPSAGSKVKLAPFFIANMPDHDTFVEPFVGGGSVFFARKDKAQKEVINDIDKGIYIFYKELKKSPQGLVNYLKGKSFAISRVRFDRIKKWKPLRHKDIAYKHIYLVWRSYGNNKLSPRITWPKNLFSLSRRLKNLLKTGERLKGVTITNQDGLSCIKRWDSSSTFFYIDPPYPKAGEGLFKFGSFSYDLQKFASELNQLKGKFIMSLNDIPEVRAAFNKDFYVYQIVTPYGRLGLKGHSNKYSELVISNYKLPKASGRFGKSVSSVRKISAKAKGREAAEATRDELRKKAEKSLGDWYMVESDKVLPSRIQHHVRGILIGDELSECKKLLKKDRDKAWGTYDLLTLKCSIDELRNEAQKADDKKGDVTGAIASSFDEKPKDVALDQLYTLGSIHGDWRKPHPSMDYLSSSWTLMVHKSCLQRVSDGKVIYLLRDHVMENEEKDTFLSQKKCPSIIDPGEDDLLPAILQQVPSLTKESFAMMMALFPESLEIVADAASNADAAFYLYETIQPILWLNLVSNKRKSVDVPAKSLPEGEGEVLQSSSRFIWVADTRMVYGAQKSDYHEYFHFFQDINNDVPHHPAKSLSGRWNWTLVPSRPGYTKAPKDEFWLGSRPIEQSPYVTTHDRQKEEEKAKRDKIEMIWNEKTLDLLRDLGYPNLG